MERSATAAMVSLVSSLLAACASGGGAGSQDMAPPQPTYTSGPAYKTCPLGGFSGFLTCMQYKDNLDELYALLLQGSSSSSGSSGSPSPPPFSFPTANPLSFASWGPWAADGNPSAEPTGIRTPTEAIPKAGSAVFSGYAAGTYYQMWDTGVTSGGKDQGTVTLWVDFAGTQVRALFGLELGGHVLVDADLSGNTYSVSKSWTLDTSFVAPSSTEAHTDSLSGAFFGPGATETAGTYKFTVEAIGLTNAAQGSFGAKLCPGQDPC